MVRYGLPLLSGVLFALGISGHGFLLAVLGVMLFMLWIGVVANQRRDSVLRAAGPGSVRVETVKQSYVGSTMAAYAQAGWELVSQSSAKSFGSQARVTLTFRKD